MATGRTMVLMACSLALVQLVAICQAGQAQELCSGEEVELHSLGDLEQTSAAKCDESVVKAFQDLKKLVLEDKNICTGKKATAITQYYETHLKNGRQGELPRELVRFAIAYGMQANSQCKWHMTGQFYDTVDKTVYEDEYEAIKQWTSDEGRIARLLRPIIEQGEFLVPSDFETLLPKPEREALLELDSIDEEKLVLVKDLCMNIFRPLYSEMLLPIAHLDRHGLDYKSGSLTKHLAKSTETRKHNILWSRIVFLCETLKERGDIGDEIAPRKWRTPHITKYHPLFAIEDRVVDDSKSTLKSAIDSYDVNLSEQDRFKARISDALESLYQSKESMASLIEKAFEIENGGGDQSEELRSTKKELLSLLDPTNRDQLVGVISKMSQPDGLKKKRRIASALVTSMLMTGALVLPGIALSDFHAFKRDFSVQPRPFKRSNMKNHSFKDA